MPALLRSIRHSLEAFGSNSLWRYLHAYRTRVVPFKKFSVSGWENGELWMFCNKRYHFIGRRGPHGEKAFHEDGWAEVEGAVKLFDHYLCLSPDGRSAVSQKTRLEMTGSTWETPLPAGDEGRHAFACSAFKAVKLNSRMDEMLRKMPSGGEVAELGVDTGAFGRAILQVNQPARLHLVDIWDSVPDPYPSLERARENFQKVEEMFAGPIAEGRVRLHKGDDLEYLARFPDHHFDWIYIDTTHYLRQTLRELELAARKVKPQGFICGHDFWDSTFSRRCRFAVIDAVREFTRKNPWELAYLTEDEPHSFVLRARASSLA